MPKMMLHKDEARLALSRGVEKLTRAVEGTLGPKGMNVVIDVPIGTPITSRDGVSIAAEVELPCRFENMGAQIVREVSKQTNEVAGDGTTTATVLANAMVQEGIKMLDQGVNAVDLVAGIETGVEAVTKALQKDAIPLESAMSLKAVAVIAANDNTTGELVADAITQVGPEGTVAVELGLTVETTLEVAEGMTFDRGYISHHMITDVEKMQVILDDPFIFMTDQKIGTPEEIAPLCEAVAQSQRKSLLIISEEIAPDVLVSLLSRKNDGIQIAAIHPPEYGHWRKAMLEDLAILTGGRVIARDLGGKIATARLDDLGKARQVRIAASETTIVSGGGDPTAVAARRAQVTRQLEMAPNNIEQDKLVLRLAKLSGGSAVILAGGATPVEQRRRGQLIEDALNAARAAVAEGIVPGGGSALAHATAVLDSLMDTKDKAGAQLLKQALSRPLYQIAENSGANATDVVAKVMQLPKGTGFNARNGQFEELVKNGVVDPVKVCYTALRNAASVASLILTTHTLIADRSEHEDPTQGPALGGGAERL